MKRLAFIAARMAFISALLIPSKVWAGDLHLTAHTASYAGLVAAGGGWNSTGSVFKFDVESLIGYVPPQVGGESLWGLSLRSRISLTDWPVYMGAMMLISGDPDTFAVLPGRYPDKYYPPTKLRFAAYAGYENRFGPYGLYGEIASLDTYLEYWYRNMRAIDLRDIVSLGFGIRYYLGAN